MIDLIVCQGRVADRKSGTIEGARHTAQEFERVCGTRGLFIGKAATPANDDWQASLAQAGETLVELGRAVSASIERGNLPVMVANTCSASLASLPVIARHHPDAVVLWIDAHGDFNTPETTETGYLGGMVLAGACGLWNSGHGAGLRPENVIVVGARDIDQAEGELLKRAGIRIIPSAIATPAVVSDAICGARVWIHVDWDVLEPGCVPADYEIPGGILPAQLRAIFETVSPSQLLGLELAEFLAPADPGSRAAALSIILDIVHPLLEATQTTSS